MPGDVSDSYDPEWGTEANRDAIFVALGQVYARVSAVLGGAPPMPILDLVAAEESVPPATATARLTVKEWRLIRFALERAREDL